MEKKGAALQARALSSYFLRFFFFLCVCEERLPIKAAAPCCSGVARQGLQKVVQIHARMHTCTCRRHNQFIFKKRRCSKETEKSDSSFTRVYIEAQQHYLVQSQKKKKPVLLTRRLKSTKSM
jgi:hypothetical protein